MSAFDFFVDLANLIGVGLTLVTLVEVVRTKRWAKRKLLRTNERWRCVRLADRIIATRRMIRQMIDEPVRLKMDSWRTEFRETISEMSDDRSLSVGDKAMIKRAIRGLHVPVKDVNHEVERLRDLLISLAALEGRVSAHRSRGRRMNQKFKQLIDRVCEKTEAGSLEWIEAAADDAFEVGLGNVTMMVFRGITPQENLPYVGVTLFDEVGRVIENETFHENPDFGSSRAEDLYRLARSKARDSDRTLDELLRGLS